MKVRETKKADELQAGDFVVSWAIDGGDPIKGSYPLTDTAKVTAKAITLFHSGTQKRISVQPGAEVTFTVMREATDEERVVKEREHAEYRIRSARERCSNVETKIAKVNKKFADKVVEQGVESAIKWHGDIVQSVEILERWGMVDRIATNLFRAQVDLPYEERTLSIDAALVKAVLIVVRETKEDLLRGSSARSTNPYSNAIEDDKREGKAKWLRDMDVVGVEYAAELLGITIDDEKE